MRARKIRVGGQEDNCTFTLKNRIKQMIIHFAQQHVIPPGQEDFFPACSEAGLLMPKK
jgi:hypothetical protein